MRLGPFGRPCLSGKFESSGYVAEYTSHSLPALPWGTSDSACASIGCSQSSAAMQLTDFLVRIGDIFIVVPLRRTLRQRAAVESPF